jgi:antitoxin component YwqK of YwqJK toxin-antitoxin module
VRLTMKKLLILLFSLLISFNSYGEVELDFSLDTFCDQSPKAQVRDGLFYLPNQQKPYSGENLCVYLSNGQYYSQGEMKKGLRTGKWTFWYENGQIQVETNYQYNENGQLEKGEHYKDGKLIGETKYAYYENSQKVSEVNYKDDKKHGKSSLWYVSGQKWVESNYKNGKRDGKWTYWYENGQIIAEEWYKDGVCISGDCPD